MPIGVTPKPVLSTRTRNLLARHGITTVEQVRALTLAEIAGMYGAGAATVEDCFRVVREGRL